MTLRIHCLQNVSHTDSMLADVLDGLSQEVPSIPCKYLYDGRGARLFERICRLPEYYQTRTEQAILHEYGERIAQLIPADCHLLDLGAGEGLKTDMLLDAIRPAIYTPIDIVAEQLALTAARVHGDRPDLRVEPVQADFTRPLELPAALQSESRRFVFFPGSTIGNFARRDAVALLTRLRRLTGDHGGLLVGFDRVKPVAELEAAYNDADGVTAAFNRNILAHINRSLGWDLPIGDFDHHAPWLAHEQCIEMRLVARRGVSLPLPQRPVIPAGSHIVTERSYKFQSSDIVALATSAGYSVTESWTDRDERFTVALLQPWLDGPVSAAG